MNVITMQTIIFVMHTQTKGLNQYRHLGELEGMKNLKGTRAHLTGSIKIMTVPSLKKRHGRYTKVTAKICPELNWDGGELSYCTCKVCDYEWWWDSSFMKPRPKDCPHLDKIACFRMERKED